MTEALRVPTKDSCNLVRFAYGDPETLIQYTDFSSPHVNSTPRLGGIYVPLPTLEITMPKKSGTLTDEDLKIVLPLVPFTARLSNGEPHADVKVHVMEYNKNPQTDGITLVHFIGWVTIASRNFGGKADRVQLTAKSWKAMLNQKCGKPMVRQCDNEFGGARCGVDVEALKETGTLTGIEGKRVTITGLAAHDERYWHNGYMEFDGLRIRIRDWLEGTTFEMGKAPPQDWIGETITVAPGCDHLKRTCIDVWDNEEHFNGAGIKVAARNPVFETR